jgi:transposase-like protein
LYQPVSVRDQADLQLNALLCHRSLIPHQPRKVQTVISPQVTSIQAYFDPSPALLRREGLYTSHISQWRNSRDRGTEKALAEKPAGRPARSAESAEIEKLKTENEKLTAELARTKAALEVVGKAHALLELLSESADSGAKRPR